jgi:hypothetical protein
MKYGHDDYYYEHLHRPTIEGSYSEVDTEDWLVQHVEWRSQKKVGFLTFQNEFGEEQIEMVSEDYKVPEDSTIRKEVKKYGQKVTYYDWRDEMDMVYTLYWDWIPEVWTGTKIGHDIYCLIGPKEVQFRSVDDPRKVKLGYHGLVYNAMNAIPVSLMDRMKPFQYLYFIIMHRLKRLIAQDQGKVFHFDVTMVDPALGLEKTMYYLKEMNIDFYNPLQSAEQPGLATRAKVSHATDMSNVQHIMNYVNLLAAIDMQISEVAGVTRQREGQAAPNEAVSNAQSNLQMSAIITEIFFSAHNKLWEEILTSLVQATQYAWKGKSIAKQYVLPDMSTATLSMTADDLSDSDIGVFISDSSKENEMFNALRAMSEGLLNTNRAKMSDLITLYDTTSLQELKAAILASEKKMQQEQMEMQQQQIEAQQQMQQSQQQFELEMQARDLDTKIKVAQIGSFRFLQDQDANDNNVPDQLEIEKFTTDTYFREKELEMSQSKLDLDAEKLEAQKQKDKEELQIKRSKPTSSK